MGAHSSSPRELETKLLRTQSDLKKTLKKKASKENFYITLKFIRRFCYFLFLIELIVVFILRRKIPIIKTAQLISQRELPILLLFIAIFTFFLPAIIQWQINSLQEEAMNLKFKLEKSFKEYQAEPKFQKVKKALEKRNEYFEIDFDQLLNLDYYNDIDTSNKQTLFQRIINSIAQTGPDYRYAVICPYCHNHNGTIDPSERNSFQPYECRFCHSMVTMTEVVSLPVKKETVHDTKVDDQVAIEELEESDEELNDLK